MATHNVLSTPAGFTVQGIVQQFPHVGLDDAIADISIQQLPAL